MKHLQHALSKGYPFLENDYIHLENPKAAGKRDQYTEFPDRSVTGISKYYSKST